MLQRNKKLILIGLLALTFCGIKSIDANAEWKKNNIGWWYSEGSSWVTGWKLIDGNWYYFDNNGYMLHNTIIDGYQLGSNGSLINSSTTKNKGYIGFNEVSLSKATKENLKQFYNQDFWILNDIKYLSIAGKNYLNVYRNGNILGADGTATGSDYIFDLNGKYDRFTALIGMDDEICVSKTSNNTDYIYSIENKDEDFGITITAIADGYILDTKKVYYGDEPIKIELKDLDKYNELILRVQCKAGICYDILNGTFYYK